MKNLLIISPHPDDEAIGCGGLISKTINEGGKVSVLYCAVGNCRQLVTGETTNNVRLKEAESCSILGSFNYTFIFVGNEFMRLDSLPQKQLIDPIEDYISQTRPDTICIPSQNSYDQDHRAVFNAAYTALRPVPQDIRHFCNTVLEYEEPYSWNVGENFKPNFYIRLNEELIAKKLSLIGCHKSQIRNEPFPRSLENIKRLSQIRGAEAGTNYAEAYRCHRTVL